MSSTEPQGATPSKEDAESLPAPSKMDEKDQYETSASPSKSDNGKASGDHKGTENSDLIIKDRPKVNDEPLDTDCNIAELLKDSIEPSISSADKQCEDEDSLLKSDDESEETSKLKENVYLKLDTEADILKSCIDQSNSPDLDSLSSEMQDEEMILKWDDDDEIEEPNMELETAILNEDTDMEHVASMTNLQKPEEIAAVRKEILAEIEMEVTKPDIENVTSKSSSTPREDLNETQVKTIENMDIDNQMTVDNIIANLDQIIDEDTCEKASEKGTNNVESLNLDMTEKSTKELVDPSASSNTDQCKLDSDLSHKNEMVDSSDTVDDTITTKNNIKEIECTEVQSNTQETENKIDVDITAIVQDSTAPAAKLSDKEISIDISIDSAEKSLNESYIENKETLPQYDIKVKQSTPKSMDGDNLRDAFNSSQNEVNTADCSNTTFESKMMDTELNTTSGNDSLDLSIIEAREHGLNEPNMMIEIPTQEFIDFEDSLDNSIPDTELGENVKLPYKGGDMNDEDAKEDVSGIENTTANVLEELSKNVLEPSKSKASVIEEEKIEEIKSDSKEQISKNVLEQSEASVIKEEIKSDSKEVSKDMATKDITKLKATQETVISSTIDTETPMDIDQPSEVMVEEQIEIPTEKIKSSSNSIKEHASELPFEQETKSLADIVQKSSSIELADKVDQTKEAEKAEHLKHISNESEIQPSSSTNVAEKPKDDSAKDTQHPVERIPSTSVTTEAKEPTEANEAPTIDTCSKEADIQKLSPSSEVENLIDSKTDSTKTGAVEVPNESALTADIQNSVEGEPSTSLATELTKQEGKPNEVTLATDIHLSIAKQEKPKKIQHSVEESPSTSLVTELAKQEEKPNEVTLAKDIHRSVEEPTPSTSFMTELAKQEKKLNETTVAKDVHNSVEEPTPSTSFMTELAKQEEKPKETALVKDIQLSVEESIPSTSFISEIAKPMVTEASTFMTQIPDTSDEAPEVTDSLGLLAESSRVMDDEEEQETSEHDDADDDDDFDPEDESSNQMTAEHSEDSNAQHSDSYVPKERHEGYTDAQSKDGKFDFIASAVSGADECAEDNIGLSEEVDITSDTNDDEQHMDQAEESMDTNISKAIKTEEKESKDEDQSDQANAETVKLSDTSHNDGDKIEGKRILDEILAKSDEDKKKEKLPDSPSKTKKLEVSKPKHVVNIVDLEESSSEDDVQEVTKDADTEVSEEVTNVNISDQIEIMSSGGNTSEIVTKEGEIVISGVPKPKLPHKPARLNTSEVTIKTTTKEMTSAIPKAQITDQTAEKSKPMLGLEVFSLDSDEEDSTPVAEPMLVKQKQRCINASCAGESSRYWRADSATVAHYDARKKKKPLVCQPCAEIVYRRGLDLLQGVKDFTPLLNLAVTKTCQELVEISDSDDDDDEENKTDVKDTIGAKGAQMIQEKLASMLNETWLKYNMDERLKDTEQELNTAIKYLEDESREIDMMLNECQVATDKLRNDLYATFEHEHQALTGITIIDTPESVYSIQEDTQIETRQLKRRLSSITETPPKRPAIALGYTPLDGDTAQEQTKQESSTSVDSKIDDDKDISVVKLSAEAAPPGLPPPGELTRPQLQAGDNVFATRNAYSSWMRARVLDYTQRDAPNTPFSMCRVKFEMKNKSTTKLIPARYIAYFQPCDVRLTIGTRIIALFKEDFATTTTKKRTSYYSGVVAEIPNPVNSYRYLVFFDDGYAQYVRHADTRLVVESSSLVWEEVHALSREFVKQYLLAYPERPMVRLHTGQSLKTEWNGKWWVSKVVQVDASLVQVHFEEDGRTEWIYRGSTRLAPLYLELQAAERHRARPRNRAQARTNMPYVEYTRSDEQAQKSTAEPPTQAQQEEIRQQRAVAKKSTVSAPAPPPSTAPSPVTSRVVYYTPKNAVKPYKMVTHQCSPKCKRSDVLALSDLRTYNPLAKPLLSGWERQIVRYKGHKDVMYRAPCGRRLRNMRELHRYLRVTRADMGVDLFDFSANTHCLAEFVLNKCFVGKKDLSNGKENVPVPCVNYYDDTLPEFCSYNTERTPTAGVPLNIDPEFLCGCDCTDDCEDKSKCACWKMTLEGARTIGLKGNNVGYVYKRLPEPLPSGIYECNSRCKCKHTCLNRVAQHPLQLKLQVFKTPNRGWGIRALNDVPKGSFLCVYAGNLLTDATANLDGLNEGDEYLAELDYIEVVEQMKEGYEDDIPKADKKLDSKESGKQESDAEEEEESSADEEQPSKNEEQDDDFQPGFLGSGISEFRKQLRKRDRATNDKEEQTKQEKKETSKEGGDDDCITISDDEEVREPSRFMAQAGMANQFVSKYRSVRSYFGKDEACYIMDAKVQGNIGRYLNHSCCPNVFVQNVFVDTHDPRFPWVSFFAASHIRAGTELTWNYNYDIGSVPGKVLYCYCGAPNCRGRLL